MRRVMVVYGTRPEAIKMAPVVRALEASAHLSSLVVLTGQHRAMLDQVNSLFGIEAAHDLDIISPRQTLEDITTRTLVGLRPVLEQESPDAVIAQAQHEAQHQKPDRDHDA